VIFKGDLREFDLEAGLFILLLILLALKLDFVTFYILYFPRQ
jgi:hypothetical protein